MGKRDEKYFELFDQLGMASFKERVPWIGGDLQTLRDTFIREKLPAEKGIPIYISVPEQPNGVKGSGFLLALLDLPNETLDIKGLVLMLHGLGGSSQRLGLRRMALSLLEAGFAILRVNLRGADPGRHLVAGTYAAECNSDMGCVLIRARELCNKLMLDKKRVDVSIPLFGVGISLGGTILLNACLGINHAQPREDPILDGLICTSSPLDLAACSASIERPRNRIYQRWLLKRLIKQTLADPFGLSPREKELFLGVNTRNNFLPKTIRAFDEAFTAPRWGYQDVDAYYKNASPLSALVRNPICMPPTLLLQAIDDPWVPVESAEVLEKTLSLSEGNSQLKLLITSRGGHNGFHGIQGCWGDLLVRKWLEMLVAQINL